MGRIPTHVIVAKSFLFAEQGQAPTHEEESSELLPVPLAFGGTTVAKQLNTAIFSCT